MERVHAKKNLYHDHMFHRNCGQGETFCRYFSSQNVLKTCWRHVNKTTFLRVIRLEDVLRTSERGFEDILNISWKRLCKTSWKRLEDEYTCLRKIWRRIYLSWSRSLEDVFTKANVCWVTTDFDKSIFFSFVLLEARRSE